MIEIIGIIGRMRSGKTTFAAKLNHVLGYEVMAFGEYVRRELAEAWFAPLGGSDIGTFRDGWGELEQDWKAELRPLLQAWGHGRRCLVDEDYWVDALFEEAEKFGHSRIVIGDVRYPNEMKAILDRGGKIIRLNAPTSLLLERGATEEALAHPSEQALTNLSLLEISAHDDSVVIPADGTYSWIDVLRFIGYGEGVLDG